MTESEFISLIDCCFPYHDRAEAQRLIVLGCSISSNAAFMVVGELVQLPASAMVTAKRRLELLQEVDAHFKHPIKDLIMTVARRCIDGSHLSLSETIDGMQAIAPFPHQYCALNVMYSAASEPWDDLDSLHHEITERWKVIT